MTRFALIAILGCVATSAAIAQPSEAIKKQVQGGEAYNRGDLPTAIAALNEAIRLNSAGSGAYLLHCTAGYETGGANREAMEDCTEALRLSPDYADAYYERGVIRAQSYGDNQAALQDFNTAIRLRPNFAQALFKRGDMLVSLAIEAHNEIELTGKTILRNTAEAPRLQPRRGVLQARRPADRACRSTAGAGPFFRRR